MANIEEFYSVGDTRYFREYGTSTVNTTTGLVFSQTVCSGARNHALQVDVLAPQTSTVAFSCVMQGSIDFSSASNWADIVGTTITASGTGTSFYAAPTNVTPSRHVRGKVVSVNTSCSNTINMKMFGIA